MKESELEFEKKLLNDVVEQFSNPKETERKQKYLRRVIYVLGYLGMLVSFIMAMNEMTHPFISSFLAGISGCAIGFAIILQYVQKQWPFTRNHINMESIRKRLEELES